MAARRSVQAFRAAGQEKERPSSRGRKWGSASAVLTRAAHSITSPLSVKYYPDATGHHPNHPPGMAHMVTQIISIDSNLVGGDPDKLETPLTPDNITDLESLMGVLFHEAGHLAHSHETTRRGWRNPDDHSQPLDTIKAADAITAISVLLEEPRMEARTIETNPRTSHYMRAASRQLILPTVPPNIDGTMPAISALALVYGRSIGGTLTVADAAAATKAATETMGKTNATKAMKLVEEATKVSDLDAPHELPRIARELYALVPESEKDSGGSQSYKQVMIVAGKLDPLGEQIPDPDGSDTGPDDNESTNGPGSNGENEGDAGQQLAKEIAEAIEAAAEDASSNGNGNDPDTGNQIVDQLTQLADEIRRGAEHPEANHGVGTYPGNASGNIPAHGNRAPVTVERAAATKLCERLRQARGHQLQAEGRVTPPGRFNSRGALSRKAERQRGGVARSAAFRDKRRVKAELWTPECGLIVDTSSSMNIGQSHLGSVIWVCQEAVFSMEGNFAAALFGNGTKPIVGNGERLLKVPEIEATGGTDFLPEALDHVESSLRFTDQRKPRILVVVSDGAVGSRKKSMKRLADLKDRNVAVIQVNIGATGFALVGDEVAEIHNTLEIADVIGDACVAALNRHQ